MLKGIQRENLLQYYLEKSQSFICENLLNFCEIDLCNRELSFSLLPAIC